MAEVLKKFGRYFLLDQIAQGGMAEIYRARLASTDGARRLIVIKRIQAGYGNNTEFLQMFRSEIKVTMGFNHPNIVQLYDFGEEQGQPYIAMELVDGKNLRQFMNRFGEMKKSFPIDLAVYIIEQAASGLHYAHSFKDKITGEPLNIVHRDVSPQNILISYEGNIKVIDFGIAKATTNSESTRAGVIKGKPSYLSPEQISGEQLDGRSDIFALGIVLWELLVGRKLFAGDNDLAVLKLIESAQTHIKAPSTYNPAVPKELDYIVLKALAKQRERRYQSAEELQRALHRFLYSFAPDYNPTDLSYSAKDMFKNEIVEDRKRIQRLNEEVEKLLIASELVVPPPAVIYEDEKGTPTDRSDHTTHTNTLLDDPKSNYSGARDAFVTELEIGKTGTTTVEFDSSKVVKVPKSKERKPYTLDKPAPVGIRTKTDISEPEKKKSFVGTAIWGAAAAAIIAFFGPSVGIEVPFLSKMVGSEGRSPSGKKNPFSNPTSTEVAAKQVRMHLSITPQSSQTVVTVDGSKLDLSNPVKVVPVDSPLELVVQNPGFKTVRRQFVISSSELGDQKDWTMDISLEPTAAFGYLSIRTTPNSDATITVDGKTWKKRTPFEREKLPVGSYTVHLSNDLLEMGRDLTVQINEGEVTQPFDPDRADTHELKLTPMSRVPSSVRQ